MPLASVSIFVMHRLSMSSLPMSCIFMQSRAEFRHGPWECIGRARTHLAGVDLLAGERVVVGTHVGGVGGDLWLVVETSRCSQQ